MVTLGREEIRELLVESLERLERRISGEQLGRMRVQLEVEGIPADAPSPAVPDLIDLGD